MSMSVSNVQSEFTLKGVHYELRGAMPGTPKVTIVADGMFQDKYPNGFSRIVLIEGTRYDEGEGTYAIIGKNMYQ